MEGVKKRLLAENQAAFKTLCTEQLRWALIMYRSNKRLKSRGINGIVGQRGSTKEREEANAVAKPEWKPLKKPDVPLTIEAFVHISEKRKRKSRG